MKADVPDVLRPIAQPPSSAPGGAAGALAQVLDPGSQMKPGAQSADALHDFAHEPVASSQ